MKKQLKDLGEKERIATLDALYTSASVLKGREATKRFLKDLLTTSERVMLGRRILIAQHVLEGVSTRNIATRLGVGLDTVGRVKKWLDDELPGYENAIKEMKKVYTKRQDKVWQKKQWSSMKRRYPGHFLLFSLGEK